MEVALTTASSTEVTESDTRSPTGPHGKAAGTPEASRRGTAACQGHRVERFPGSGDVRASLWSTPDGGCSQRCSRHGLSPGPIPNPTHSGAMAYSDRGGTPNAASCWSARLTEPRNHSARFGCELLASLSTNTVNPSINSRAMSARGHDRFGTNLA